MNKFAPILYIVTVIVGVAVAAYSALTYLDLKRWEIENEARFQCSQSSRYQVTQTNGITTWYPAAELYTACLREKGI
ncbi:MAG TPA: hypothetical protein PLD54_02450 [Candidatus Levybacteria bacterium]|nr:hypothetical protein [Candidatus Levybacteria bacterium]